MLVDTSLMNSPIQNLTMDLSVCSRLVKQPDALTPAGAICTLHEYISANIPLAAKRGFGAILLDGLLLSKDLLVLYLTERC